MDKIRIGVIGAGTMGSSHARNLHDGLLEDAELTAVADINPKRLEWVKNELGEDVELYDNAENLIDSGCVDGIVVATPHYDHPPLGIKAFEKGLHVLLEKPVGVYTKQVKRLHEAADASGKIFGIMFQLRTVPHYMKMKDMLASGEVGDIKRNCFIATSYYRSQNYYNRGSWRATWGGEGGGVLLNQCPHLLDLWQWYCGVPRRVRAFCSYGKYHDIEVEDDVTAYVEYEDGSTGLFVASTGEAPGTQSFEVHGNMGKLVMEDGNIAFDRNRVDERVFNADHIAGFGRPEHWKCDIPVGEVKRGGHSWVTEKWIEAIAKNDSSLLIVDGREGLKSLEISNAMLLSDWVNDWVDLPVDEDQFVELLKERVKNSSFSRAVSAEDDVMNVEDSF